MTFNIEKQVGEPSICLLSQHWGTGSVSPCLVTPNKEPEHVWNSRPRKTPSASTLPYPRIARQFVSRLTKSWRAPTAPPHAPICAHMQTSFLITWLILTYDLSMFDVRTIYVLRFEMPTTFVKCLNYVMHISAVFH